VALREAGVVAPKAERRHLRAEGGDLELDEREVELVVSVMRRVLAGADLAVPPLGDVRRAVTPNGESEA
jgi:hypothetical protein